MPAPPSPHTLVAIALVLVAIYLFTREKWELESSSLFVLIVVVSWFELFAIEFEGARVRAGDFLAGFGNEALITVCALMILAQALERTGALQPISLLLARIWSRRPKLAFLATLLTAAVLSMFLNNTPVVAAVLPLLVAVSLRARVPPSGILMPVGFATIIGGMATTIGTSTNLLVVSVASDYGMRELQMFDFATPVFIVGSVAILYLWLVAPRLLPDRTPPLTDLAPRVFRARLRINPGSAAADRSLSEVLRRMDNRMRVRAVTRGGISLTRLPSLTLKAGDYLLVSGPPENLKIHETLLGATLVAGDSEDHISADHPLVSEEHVAEVVVTPGSALDSASLESTQLLSLHGLAALALHRPGRTQPSAERDIAQTRLRAGDILLVQGSERALASLKQWRQVLVLDGTIDLPRTSRAGVALFIVAAVVLLAALGVLRISVAAAAGLAAMVLTGCLNWRDVAKALDRKIVMVIVASLALGLAMMATGAAEYLAILFVAVAGELSPALILAGFILIIALLTEVATNNAIAVLGTPIAVSIAAQLGVPAEPFVLGVLYGANMSYMTPVGYQTNLLVLSAGGYRFSDFFRVGLPLQIIMWAGLSLVLPVMYEL